MRESETVFWAILAAAGRADMAMAADIKSAPGVTYGAMALGPLARTIGLRDEKRSGSAEQNDRDGDRICDRDDDRDRLGAGQGATKDKRQTWFLEAVEAGGHVAASEIMDRWRVSEKTARRDIAALKANGLIEFVGTRRSGRYRPVR